MKERPFGATGLFVAEIGMGCSLLGRRRMLRADREWVRLLHRAFELGINFYDTADSYQDGLSEELIGRAFRDRRSRVIIASKVGYRTSTLTKLAKRLAGVLPYGYAVVRSSSNDLPATLTRQRQDFSPDHIQEAIEGSLKRLRTDYLDVFQLHNPPFPLLQLEEVFETLDGLKQEGKIRSYGVSAATVPDAEGWLQHDCVSSIQVPLNLLEQRAATTALPQAARKQVAVIARIPLGRGLLTRKRAVQTGPRVEDLRELEKSCARVKELTFLLKDGARTLPQAAIRFVLQYPGVSVVIPGTTSIPHLEEDVAASATPLLTEEEVRRIHGLSRVWAEADAEPTYVEAGPPTS